MEDDIMSLLSLLTTGKKVLHYANKTTVIDSHHFAILPQGNCLMTEKRSDQATYESTLFFFDKNVLITFFSKYADLIKKIESQCNEAKAPFLVLKKDPCIM